VTRWDGRYVKNVRLESLVSVSMENLDCCKCIDKLERETTRSNAEKKKLRMRE